ncbi:MAG: glycoprotease [Schwartzia sp. (in: firmicutes)]
MKEIDTKRALLAVLFFLIIISVFIGYRFANRPAAEKPAILTEEQTQDVAALQRQLDISKANAEALKKQLAEVQAERRAPAVTYYVEAPDVDRAVQVVEQQIKEDSLTLPRAAREKSDRTVVTPIKKDKEQQKVDVYKINLRRDHRIKAGASIVDGKALMSIGYEQGRFEALAHFDGSRYKGVTVMYNVIEW